MRRVWTAAMVGSMVALGAAGALAAPMPGVCRAETLLQRALVPQVLTFVVPVAGLDIDVSIDAETGEFVVHGTSIPPLTFNNSFSVARDVLWFPQQDIVGTIDSGGSVLLPDMEFRVCTFGTCPGGGGDCECIPGNLCSNDTSRLCIRGQAPPELSCLDDGVCQGVCSDDPTKSCAVNDECLPDGFCGNGSLLRLNADLSTGFVNLDELQLVGSGDEVFDTGRLTLVDIFRTNPETPVIGTTGVTSMTLGCVLDPIPAQSALPAPAYAWVLKRGVVKLGKGAPGSADDRLVLRGELTAPPAVADFAAADVSVLFNTEEAGLVANVTVPGGSMKANRKGTKHVLKDKTGDVVLVQPAPTPGSSTSHVVVLKRRKSGAWALRLVSKGLDLDALAVAGVTTGVKVEGGAQTPSTTTDVRTNKKGNKLKF